MAYIVMAVCSYGLYSMTCTIMQRIEGTTTAVCSMWHRVLVVAYVAMACTVMAYLVMAHVVVAYTVMAYK